MRSARETTNMALDLTQLEMARTKYGTMFDVEFQQLRSRVQPYTTLESEVAGERYEIPRISDTHMSEYSDTRHDIEESDMTFDKRSMRYRKFYNAISISEDEVDDMMNLDYTFSRVKSAQVAAAARKMDEIALGVIRDGTTYRLKTAADGGYMGGILGTNYKGDGGLTTVDLDYADYDGANLVPVDYKTEGTASATLSRVRSLTRFTMSSARWKKRRFSIPPSRGLSAWRFPPSSSTN